MGKDAGANIRELSHAHPEWSRDRVVAAGMNAARQAKGGGAGDKKKRKKKSLAQMLHKGK